MLGLRYHACAACETVYAAPAAAPPSACDRCAAAELVEITDRLQRDRYFVPPADR